MATANTTTPLSVLRRNIKREIALVRNQYGSLMPASMALHRRTQNNWLSEPARPAASRRVTTAQALSPSRS